MYVCVSLWVSGELVFNNGGGCQVVCGLCRYLCGTYRMTSRELGSASSSLGCVLGGVSESSRLCLQLCVCSSVHTCWWGAAGLVVL